MKIVTRLGEAASGDRQVAQVYPESLKKIFRLTSLRLINAFVTPFKNKFDGLLCCVFIVYNIIIDISLLSCCRCNLNKIIGHRLHHT